MWQSPHDKCVLQQCKKVNDEVFITATNVSCTPVEIQACPLGRELRCNTEDCCPQCYCGNHTYNHSPPKQNYKYDHEMAPSYWSYTCAVCPDQSWYIDCLMNVNKMACAFLPAASLDVCILNHTLIGVSLAERQPYLCTLQIWEKQCFTCFVWCVFAQAGEKMMIDVCTHCECLVESAEKKLKLSCKRITCSTCPLVTIITCSDLTFHHLHYAFSSLASCYLEKINYLLKYNLRHYIV